VTDETHDVTAFVLTSPNAVGLPLADRRDVAAPATSAIVDERWPRIERLLEDGRAAEAIPALEALAAEMRRTTERDAPLFREALTLARRVLYDDLAEISRVAGCEAAAREALARCAVWDEELRSRLEGLAPAPREAFGQ
jgi:hypothetical protein